MKMIINCIKWSRKNYESKTGFGLFFLWTRMVSFLFNNTTGVYNEIVNTLIQSIFQCHYYKHSHIFRWINHTGAQTRDCIFFLNTMTKIRLSVLRILKRREVKKIQSQRLDSNRGPPVPTTDSLNHSTAVD